MLRSIIWYLSFAITLALTTPQLFMAKKILKKNKKEQFDKYVYDVTSNWALNRIKLSGAKIKVYGEENLPKDINVLFMSNHQGNFDIAIFMALIKKPTGFVAKIEMLKAPLIRTWMKYINCVFMDRHDLKQSLQTILEGIKVLKSGYSLVIFPEGTRSKCDKVGEFKAGSFKLATKSKVPIVPVTIDGSYKIMEEHNSILTPANVNIYIHEPIYTESLTKDEINELPQKVKEIIEKPILKNKKLKL